MNDLVSRQVAIDRLIEKFPYIDPMAIIRVVSDLPAVDAIPVIRCKDCARCSIEVCNDYWCDGKKVWKDHYCGYAERRTDGTVD